MHGDHNANSEVPVMNQWPQRFERTYVVATTQLPRVVFDGLNQLQFGGSALGEVASSASYGSAYIRLLSPLTLDIFRPESHSLS